ncbi:hypothetical protein AVEN_78000-1 [Araneus ventricosus]|uniref:Reverse transcriptase domain-containing protein n=1 Tax=Araneus ventricosus TaxID=182803 RepID=A0A4Y2MDB6_ARAVE|nr:hypothetical protein AVEN_78000-1 [Araneus ventricosus]
MVNKHLVFYLEHNKILSPFQSGFRPGRCTIDNLLALETDIRTTFLKRQHLVAIFFDIEKAYDRTWRYGILQALLNCNLRGNLPIFIQNFLRLKQFRVKVGCQLSDPFIQEEDVPQEDTSTPSTFATNSSDARGNFFSSFSVGSLQLEILFLRAVPNETMPCLCKYTSNGTDE